MILFNTSLIFLTKTYTHHDSFHSSQWRSPFLHWAAAQPRCVALSMRVLVEYYTVPKQNGCITKVIYYVLSNRLLDASIIYILSTTYTQN